MITVGAFEAKTHLATLLDRVARGEQVTITKHGTAVARLVPASGPTPTRTRDIIEKLRSSRKGQTLMGLKPKALIGHSRP